MAELSERTPPESVVKTHKIAKIALYTEYDEDATFDIGGVLSVEDIARSSTKIEDIARVHFGKGSRDMNAIPDGWLHVPNDTILKLMQFYNTTSPSEAIWEECLRYAAHDLMRYEAWCNDDWHYLTVCAEVFAQPLDVIDAEDSELFVQDSTGGVESDADDYAHKHNKRYGLTPNSVTRPIHTQYMQPYTLEVALQCANECKLELARDFPHVSLDGWDAALAEAVELGINAL